MPVVDVNGARLWYDEAGAGEPVVLLHSGLTDSGLWEGVAALLAARFRTIRTDARFFGRSVGPLAPFSPVEDVLGLLDELALERVALVGASFGGQVAIDLALEAPERVRALVAVTPALSGYDGEAYTPGQEAEYEAAIAAGELERAAEVDFAVWAPLGVDARIRELWAETPDAKRLPPGIDLIPPRKPAAGRLGELVVPTLVVTAAHDPAAFRAIGPLVAAAAPDARHVELDSDHYLPLREPKALAAVVLDFLSRPSS